jgi:predicted lipid-binding transport protein (Tim44 family)
LSVDPLIVVLTAVAVVIFWRLKSVLGQRTGLERPPVVPIAHPEPSAKVIDHKATPVPSQPVWQGYATEGSSLAFALEKIAGAQPDFTVPEFLKGAKVAYELVLTAFAKGDKATLKNLLNKQALDSFSAVIDQHKARGETKLFQFVGVNSAKLVAAKLEGNRASVEVLFSSQMINATLDKAGATIFGDGKTIVSADESWTFERDVTSRDPNWKLVATSDAAE